MKKTTVSIPSYLLNLWSLAPHQLPPEHNERDFSAKNLGVRKSKDGSPPDFSGGKASECTQGLHVIVASGKN